MNMSIGIFFIPKKPGMKLDKVAEPCGHEKNVNILLCKAYEYSINQSFDFSKHSSRHDLSLGPKILVHL